MDFIGKLLPIDGYYVVLADNLTKDYTQSLTHLYQPLIGFEAVALYHTLLHEMQLQNDKTVQTHHTLMNYLNVSLDRIYDMRLKLEGIGLLNTYENEDEDKKIYIYELVSPFSPKAFFQDAMLTQLLYYHLGETKFKSLKSHYNKEQSVQGKNITASFHDVFQTFKPANIQIEQNSKAVEQHEPLVEIIDFSQIETMLKQQMIPVHRVLTERNKKIISQLAHLYDLELYEVEKSILWALTDENKLNINEFKEACHDLFQMKYNDVPIRLQRKKRVQPKTNRKPMTKEERLIQTLETISPKQLLEDLSSGGHASAQDMKLIRDVMLKQGLQTPVMNVLIHYVLLQSNMQLSKAYLEKIASHWSRANLKTAKEAMEFAKQQIKQFKERKKPNKTATNEVIPEWFENRNEKANQPKNLANNNRQRTNEEEEILALLQKHASKKD